MKHKNPDPIFAARDQVVGFFIENRRAVLASIGVLLAGLLIWLGFRHFQETQIVKDNQVLSETLVKNDAEALRKYVDENQNSKVVGLGALNLLNLYIQQSKWDEAQALLKSQRQHFPEFIQSNADWSQAQLLWQAGKVDEALAFLETRIQDSKVAAKEKSTLELLKAQLLVAAGKPDEAAALFEKLSKAGEQDAWVLQNARAGWIALKLAPQS